MVRQDHKIFKSESSFIDEPDDKKQSQFDYVQPFVANQRNDVNIEDTHEIVEESLSLENNEIDFIKRALQKHNGKRKFAAKELGISERTLYRKINEYNI